MSTQEISFTAVDHRDGEQQYTTLPSQETDPEARIEARLEVFSLLEQTGVDIIEVGHGANATDIAFMRQLPEPSETSPALQILLSSQPEVIESGLTNLAYMNPDTTIIHIYDRLAEGLRNSATKPYGMHESARRVAHGVERASKRGYKRISVSGEGATDVNVEEAVHYYRKIIASAAMSGVAHININLANTYGFSAIGEWDQDGLTVFNHHVKEDVPIPVSTSIHTHDDMGTSAEFVMAAIRAGFDRIEGTTSGMGERSGNVAIPDVICLMLEDARHQVAANNNGPPKRSIGRSLIDWQQRFLADAIVDALPVMYTSAKRVADIYGAQDRFEDTIIGSPHVFKNGSGPHDQLAARAIEDPVSYPFWKAYGSLVPVFAVMGHPEAMQIMHADPAIMRDITVGNHAGGGNTAKIVAGEIIPASKEVRDEAIRIANAFMREMIDLVTA